MKMNPLSEDKGLIKVMMRYLRRDLSCDSDGSRICDSTVSEGLDRYDDRIGCGIAIVPLEYSILVDGSGTGSTCTVSD
jgi:hypothetical protein